MVESFRGIENETARGTPADRDRLQALADQLAAIDTGAFSKYQDLLQFLHALRWNGRDARDRLVIFSERIATVAWLAERLRADLGLPEEQVVRIVCVAVPVSKFLVPDYFLCFTDQYHRTSQR